MGSIIPSILLSLLFLATLSATHDIDGPEKLYEDAYAAYASGDHDLALDALETLDRELREPEASLIRAVATNFGDLANRRVVLGVRARHLQFLVLTSKSQMRAASMVQGLVQGVVASSDTHSGRPQAAFSGGVIGLSRELMHRIQAVDTVISPRHDRNLDSVSSSAPLLPAADSLISVKAPRLENERVAIIIPTHPPYYRYVDQFLESCAAFNCSSTTDIWLIFTNEHEQSLFELGESTRRYPLRALWRGMVCGDRCLGGGCEPNTKKFVGLVFLMNMIASGDVYPYRYAVCFDSETAFVRDPAELPAAIARSDEKRTYYHTYHGEDLETTMFPAYALLRWNRQHRGRESLRFQTADYHLHGWWSELPFFDMSKMGDFFLAFVGKHLETEKHDLTAAVVAATIELGNWAFEHNVYKYYNILEHDYTITNLKNEFDFMQIQDDKRSWLEVFNLYVGNNTAHLHQLFNFTGVLWCAACVRKEHISMHDIYFQFHGDKKASCIDGYIERSSATAGYTIK